MSLQSTQGLSKCDLDLISFANELILLRDEYLQFSTDFQTTRRDINSIFVMLFMRERLVSVIAIVILCAKTLITFRFLFLV